MLLAVEISYTRDTCSVSRQDGDGNEDMYGWFGMDGNMGVSGLWSA